MRYETNVRHFCLSANISTSTGYAIANGHHEPNRKTFRLLAEGLSALTGETITVAQLETLIDDGLPEAKDDAEFDMDRDSLFFQLQDTLRDLQDILSHLEQLGWLSADFVPEIKPSNRQNLSFEGDAPVSKQRSVIAAFIVHTLKMRGIDREIFATWADLARSRLDQMIDEGEEPTSAEYQQLAKALNQGGFQCNAALLKEAWDDQRIPPKNVEEDPNGSGETDPSDHDPEPNGNGEEGPNSNGEEDPNGAAP